MTCFSTHAKVPTPSIAPDGFGLWAAGKAGPNIKGIYGTTCYAPPQPLTPKEKAAGQAVVTAYERSLS